MPANVVLRALTLEDQNAIDELARTRTAPA